MKISYHKRWDKEGTCYRQAIRIGKDDLSALKDCIDAEIAQNYPRKSQYISTSGYEMYLKPIYLSKRTIFLNLTQLRFINLFLHLELKDRNTCLLNY